MAEFDPNRKFMPLDIFVGGGGDLVIVQEWTTPGEERYLRIIANMDDAESICERIMKAAREARSK